MRIAQNFNNTIFSVKFGEELPYSYEANVLSVTDTAQTVAIANNEERFIDNVVISNGATGADLIIRDNGTEVLRVTLAANQVLQLSNLNIPVGTQLEYLMSQAGATATVTLGYKRVINPAVNY